MDAKKSGKSLSYENAVNFIDFFSVYSVPGARVMFTGGEPTLNPRILDIIEHTKRSLVSPNIYIETNGVIQSSKLDKLINSGVNFYLSFEGLPEIQDFERIFHDSSGSSEQVLRTIKQIINHDPDKLIIRLNHSKNKIGREKEVVDFFSSLGVKHVSLGVLFPKGRGKTYENVAFLGCVDGSQNFRKLFEKQEVDTGTSQNQIKEELPWPSCGAGEKSFFLSVDGKIVMCLDLNSAENLSKDLELFVVGDVNGGVKIDDKKMKKFMEFSRAVPKACESCFAKKYCGGCFMKKKIKNGVLSFDEIYCESKRSEVLKLKD